MAEFKWPEAGQKWRLGREITRIDGPAKVSGNAEYTYDVDLFGMLYGTLVVCPYAHARIVSIDTSAAEGMEGVKAVKVIQDVGAEIQWAMDEVVGIAAETEEICRDAARAVRVRMEGRTRAGSVRRAIAGGCPCLATTDLLSDARTAGERIA